MQRSARVELVSTERQPDARAKFKPGDQICGTGRGNLRRDTTMNVHTLRRVNV